MQHSGVVAQRRQSPEAVYHLADRCGPLLCRRHIERDRDHPGVIEFRSAGFQFVHTQIACGDEEAVLAQPPDDRRTLPAGRTRHQGDTAI